MLNLDTPIGEFMTPSPYAVTCDETLATAIRRMDSLKFRHLPVFDEGKPAGVLSRRELDLAVSLQGADIHTTRVGQVMTKQPCCVSANEPLRQVAAKMAEMKIGSVLVVDEQDKVTGVFTTIDALKAMAYS